MTALAAGRTTPTRTGRDYRGPVAANVICYEGGIACRDASGNLTPGATATTLVTMGIFTGRADNTGGAAAAIEASYRPGIYRFDNSATTDDITKAEIGDDCYIVDDQTVAKTSGTNTRSVAGTVVDVDSLGVWVRLGTI